MTGERIKGRDLGDRIAGKTIAAADFDSESVAIRFDDGTWIFVGYSTFEGDEHCEVDTDAEPHPVELIGIGVIDQAEMKRMIDEADERREERKRERERAEFERLKAIFEEGKS